MTMIKLILLIWSWILCNAIWKLQSLNTLFCWYLGHFITHGYVLKILANDKSTLVKVIVWNHQAICVWCSWWRDQMETFCALLAILYGEISSHRWIPRTKASDAKLWCFFDRRPNKFLSKESWGWWFETQPRPLWRHCNGPRPYGVTIKRNCQDCVYGLRQHV